MTFLVFFGVVVLGAGGPLEGDKQTDDDTEEHEERHAATSIGRRRPIHSATGATTPLPHMR